jgi:hypothetical protein
MNQFFKILILIIFFLFNFCITSFSQQWKMDSLVARVKHKNPIKQITKEQMYQDYDSLINIFKNCNPQLEIRKQVTGCDIVDEIKNLRKEIDTINNTENFIILIYRALMLSQDAHCNITDKGFYYKRDLEKSNYIKLDKRTCGLNLNYVSLINKRVISLMKLIYIAGQYYTIYPITMYQKNDSIVIPAGSEITKINNISLNDYVYIYKDIQDDIRWDFNKKCFYANSIQRYYNYEITSIEYLYKNEKIKKDNIDHYKQYAKPWDFWAFYNARCVTFFKNDSLLYVRCPLMNDNNFYKKELTKMKGYPIKKVIIDIRENYGGGDSTWMCILRGIIDKPIENKIIYLSKINNKVENYILYDNDDECNKSTIFPKWDSLYEYNVAGEDIEILKPYDSSLQYSGNIYVLQDEGIYSAAGSLTAMGQYCNNIITVGMKNERLGGRGISPMIFKLPNSKLTLLMTILIDNTNSIIAEDVYHYKVKIPITMPIEYYVNRDNFTGNIYSEDYLFNHDMLFKKILEQK